MNPVTCIDNMFDVFRKAYAYSKQPMKVNSLKEISETVTFFCNLLSSVIYQNDLYPVPSSKGTNT